MNRTIKILLILIFSLSANYFSQTEMNDNSRPIYKNNANYDAYINLFKTYKLKSAKIVMLGNSITHGGNWPELLGRDKIANRGIPGDILEGFLARINGVIKLRPDICVVMGGINDIYAWIPTDVVYKNYIKLLRKLKRNNIKPIIISTLYAGNVYHHSSERNTQVVELNTKLSKYAEQYDIEFLDLNKYLSFDGFLKQDVTIDGIHLNWKGYKIWAKHLDKLLAKYGY